MREGIKIGDGEGVDVEPRPSSDSIWAAALGILLNQQTPDILLGGSGGPEQ